MNRRLRARPPFWIILALTLVASPLLAFGADSSPASCEPLNSEGFVLKTDPRPNQTGGTLHLAYGCIPGGSSC